MRPTYITLHSGDASRDRERSTIFGALRGPITRFRSTMLACVAPGPLISRQAAPVRRSASCRATRSSDGWTAVPARAVSAFAGAVLLAGAPLSALAIPQTSACATISCDDFDYTGKDLRAEYYTKV